jgi:Sec-independent protein translocase protein TatA
MELLSVGTGEILMILLVAILVIGPNKVVKFSRKLGQLSRNLKRMTTDFSSTISKEIDIVDKLTSDTPEPKKPGVRQTENKGDKPVEPV